jgi:3-deoxy-D-manno-octulosonic-acid transferase
MLLYNIGIFFYHLFLKLAALINPKAKLWVKGRQNWEEYLKQNLIPHKNKKVIWIHTASLGEFEQARPLLEALREKYKNACIVLTFFSPSGYEVQKKYDKADVVYYLPIDKPGNALKFIALLNPSIAIFAKYEFWLNYLKVLKANKIPTYLISAVFRKHQPFFKWYGGVFRNALDSYTRIFVQDDYSSKLLQSLNFMRVQITGDTRIDRVIEIAEHSTKDLSFLETFKNKQALWIAGSTWSKDNTIVIETYVALKQKFPQLKLMIATHEVDDKSTQQLVDLISSHQLSFQLFSKPEKNNTTKADVFVLNTIGVLSSCYRLADVVYIGGGFDGGIHSILEPAAYYKPLFFGTNHHKFNEATQLIELGGAKEVASKETLNTYLIQLLENTAIQQQMALAVKNYIQVNKGATEKLIQEIELEVN